MTDPVTTDTTEVRVPDDKPPAFANSMMRWMLTTPGLQRMVGQGVALLTFTGRRSGKTYTIPVSYSRQGDTVTVITKRLRTWWHNFETPAAVEVRLAGRNYTGTAEAKSNDTKALEFLTGYFQSRPIDAKAYGLRRDEITRDKVAKILPHIVLIDIAITPNE